MLFLYTATVFWQTLRCLNIFVNLMNVSDGRVPESFHLNTFVSNVTLKQVVGNFTTNCLSLFGHFVGFLCSRLIEM